MRFRRLVANLLLAAPLLAAGVIHLKTRDIQTSGTSDSSVKPIRQLDSTRRHILVQFSSPVNAQHLAALKDLGAVVTGSINDHGLAVSLPTSATLMNLDVAWAGTLRVTDKLSPELKDDATAYVVEFHRDVTPEDAARIVHENGLAALPHPNLLPNQLLVLAGKQMLSDLAAWDEVAYIFPASGDLMSGQPLLPCPGALSNGIVTGQYVKIGNGWTNPTSGALDLQFVFTQLTDHVPDYQVKAEVERAMQAWSKVANIRFIEGTDPAAPLTVAIEWGATVNADPTPFDGPGGALAHTYYPAPPNAEPLAGDMHLDPAEDWHAGTNVDIYTVSLHELGHALGLGHTDDPTAVMYPYYRFGAQLSQSDIAGVQSMYGAPYGTEPDTTPGPVSIAPAPSTTPSTSAALNLVIGAVPGDGQPVTDDIATLQGQVINASSNASVVWQTNFGQSGRATGVSSWTASGIPLSLGANWISVTVNDPGRLSISRSVQVTRAGDGLPTTSTPTPTPAPTPTIPTPPPATPAPVAPSPSTPSSGATAPTLTILSPQPPVSTSDSTITINGTASDASGIAQVTWQTNGGYSGTANGTTNWTASGIPLFVGTNTVLFTAYNTAGASRWQTISVTRK